MMVVLITVGIHHSMSSVQFSLIIMYDWASQNVNPTLARCIGTATAYKLLEKSPLICLQRFEQNFDNWQQAKQETKEEDTRRLRSKLNLQQELIKAQEEQFQEQQLRKRQQQDKVRTLWFTQHKVYIFFHW